MVERVLYTPLNLIFQMFWAIFHHQYNLKNVKNTHVKNSFCKWYRIAQHITFNFESSIFEIDVLNVLKVNIANISTTKLDAIF